MKRWITIGLILAAATILGVNVAGPQLTRLVTNQVGERTPQPRSTGFSAEEVATNPTLAQGLTTPTQPAGPGDDTTALPPNEQSPVNAKW
jgi:hypothetical protein